jgi:acetyl-CoA carboxylase carboxyl transferase subunit beta
VGAALGHELATLTAADAADRKTERARRFERLGKAGPILARVG